MTALHHIGPLMAGSNSDHSGFWWLPFGLVWIVLLGTVIWLVVRTVRQREPSGVERAIGILAERFARGELSGEEYRERLDELGRQR
jgi:putative membrane protein